MTNMVSGTRYIREPSGECKGSIRELSNFRSIRGDTGSGSSGTRLLSPKVARVQYSCKGWRTPAKLGSRTMVCAQRFISVF